MLKKCKAFKTVKGGPLGLFENPVCSKISEEMKGGPFGDKKFVFEICKKKTKNENFEQSHSAEILERGDPLGFLAL